MKVRNKSNIVFPKGLEFLHDIQPGQEAIVIMGREYTQRLQNAIASGYLEVIDEPVSAQSSDVKETTKSVRMSDGTIVSTTASTNDDVRTLLGQKVEEAHKSTESVSHVVDEWEQFQSVRGKARIKFIQQMTDIATLRKVLNTTKGKKTKEAAEQRIRELSNAPRSVDDIQ